MTWTEQVAVVTGGARGIGRAVSLEFARQGVTVVAADLNLDGTRAVAEEAKTSGLPGKIVPKSLNVTDRTAIEAFVEEVIQEFGKISILVNNAGITRDGLVMKMSESDWNDVLRINLTGTFLCTKACLRYMLKKRWGRIINMSSIIGLSGNAGQANYAASKAGIIGFTKAMAKEIGSRGITVNAIAPGYIESDMTLQLSAEQTEQIKKMTALGKTGTVNDVAEAIAFLASEKAGYITGHVLNIDGGMGGI